MNKCSFFFFTPLFSLPRPPYCNPNARAGSLRLSLGLYRSNRHATDLPPQRDQARLELALVSLVVVVVGNDASESEQTRRLVLVLFVFVCVCHDDDDDGDGPAEEGETQINPVQVSLGSIILIDELASDNDDDDDR